MKDAAELCQKTLNKPVQAFAMISNWIQDFPIYQEKVFTLQVMALMKDKTPQQLLIQLNKGNFNLDNLLVFNNDFTFYEFCLQH